MNRLKTKIHPASVIIAGLLTGLVISAPALAIQSAATGTVVGRAPVVTGDAGGEVVVTDVNHNNIIDAGDTLAINTNKFTQTDADTDAPAGFEYTWLVGGASPAGTTTASTSYTIKAADAGKDITLSVVGTTDPTKTDPAVSSKVDAKFSVNASVGLSAVASKITVATADNVSTAVITGYNAKGDPEVGTKLSVDVTMANGNPPAAGKVEYQWKVETTPGSGTYTNVAGTKGTASEYTPVAADQRKHIVVEVTKK